ncbi:hypothetical protein RvY_07323 [Ramazzottius varieornatus]|uniref:Uncharacterized protein n=1 Tax=Ramazzottius varieornatus TaxID=947166 RepID=A0A1D1V7V6_RAMVA|nr:hypothetical protein RvY_07323 [Ramazzottius varieornatus]
MKRFFQSLHKHSGGSSHPVAVERSECNRNAWKQAATIQRLQKELAYYYHQNFLLQTDLTAHLLDHQIHAVAINADKEIPDDCCNTCNVNECGEPIPTCFHEVVPVCHQPVPTCHQEPPPCSVSPRNREVQSTPNEALSCPLRNKERTSSCSPCSSTSRSPPSFREKVLRRFASSDNELVPKLSSGVLTQSACLTKPKSGKQPSSTSHRSWTRMFRSKERMKPSENPTVCSLNRPKKKSTQSISPCEQKEQTVSLCERPKSSCKTADESKQCLYRPPIPYIPRGLGTSNSDGSLIEHHRQPFPPLSPRVNFKDSTYTKAASRILSGDQSRPRLPTSTPPPSPVVYPFTSFDSGSTDASLPPIRSFTPSSDFTQTITCPRATECTQTQANVSSKEASCEVAIPVAPPPASPVVNDRGAEWRELARKILTTSIQAEYLGIKKYKTYDNLEPRDRDPAIVSTAQRITTKER